MELPEICCIFVLSNKQRHMKAKVLNSLKYVSSNPKKVIFRDKDNIAEGQWLFTCSMKPLQFKSWDSFRDPKNYFNDEDLHIWKKYTKDQKFDFVIDSFETTDGSSHTRKNCSLRLVSEKYALWFIENKCWDMFDDSLENCWEAYELKIRSLCERDGIVYEGL